MTTSRYNRIKNESKTPSEKLGVLFCSISFLIKCFVFLVDNAIGFQKDITVYYPHIVNIGFAVF